MHTDSLGYLCLFTTSLVVSLTTNQYSYHIFAAGLMYVHQADIVLILVKVLVCLV